ncbi:MAG: ribosome maturation factor RimM [Holosporales bacterium]|jgi:16S rRNA processing protein RimM|nr:ribosome maturation factor RimM [Holosporales bacterium]
MPDDRVCIGLITKPVGIAGDVRIRPYVLATSLFLKFREVSLEDFTPLNIISARIAASGDVVSRIADRCTRESVECLRLKRLYVSKDEFPRLGNGEYYLFDLQNLEVFGKNGDCIGRVILAQDFGAGAFLEIQLFSRKIQATLPFRKESVLAVDLAIKQIRVDEDFLIY